MSNNFFTPITTGAAANASTINNPLGELDAQITTHNSEIVAGRGGFASLDARFDEETDNRQTADANLQAQIDDLEVATVASSGVGTTTLAANASGGATSITVASISGFVNGDYITILLDSGDLHATTISGAPSGSTINLADALPGTGVVATSGNVVSKTLVEVALARTAIHNSATVALTLPETVEFASQNIYHAGAYGAVGDGSTDDAAAIQLAIEAANAAGGGIVVFAPGTYIVGSALTPRSNVLMRGAGKHATTLKRASGYTSYLLLNTVGMVNAGITDMTLDGRVMDAGGHLVDIRDSYNLHFERVRFRMALESLIKLDGCVNLLGWYQNRFIDCDFEYATRAGIELNIVNGTTNVATGNAIIRGCTFSNLTTVGVGGVLIKQEKVGGDGGSNYVISDCLFDETIEDTGVAIFGADADNVVISNCIAKTELANYWLQGKNYGGLTNITVQNCTARSENDGGIFLINADRFQITGNTASDCGYEGITVSSSQNGAVTGNTTTNNGRLGTADRTSGLRLNFFDNADNICKNIEITGNRSGDTRSAGSKTQEYGLNLNSKDENVQVAGNNFFGNAVASIRDRAATDSGYLGSVFFSGNLCDDRAMSGDATNLLSNPSLEDWTGSSPDNWSTSAYASGGTGSTAQETTTKRYGSSAAKLTQTNTTGNFYLTQAVTLDAGVDYVFSVWVYVPAANTPTGIAVGVSSLGPSSFAALASGDVGKTGAWQLLACRFNTTGDASGDVWVRLTADNANDYILIDGARLSRGSEIVEF